MNKAVLTNADGFTVFRYGDKTIRFKAPYSLEHYCTVKEWDDGYLVVTAKYAHNQTEEEEYIDLCPILDDLYIDKRSFLSQIKEVVIENG